MHKTEQFRRQQQQEVKAGAGSRVCSEGAQRRYSCGCCHSGFKGGAQFLVWLRWNSSPWDFTLWFHGTCVGVQLGDINRSTGPAGMQARRLLYTYKEPPWATLMHLHKFVVRKSLYAYSPIHLDPSLILSNPCEVHHLLLFHPLSVLEGQIEMLKSASQPLLSRNVFFT